MALQTFKRPVGKDLTAIYAVFTHVQVIAKSLEYIDALSGKKDAPSRDQVVHGEFTVELYLAGDAVGNLLPLVVIKRDVDLELTLTFIEKAGEGHEFRAPRVGRRAEALEHAPKVVVLCQDILQDVIAAQECGNLRQVEIHKGLNFNL